MEYDASMRERLRFSANVHFVYDVAAGRFSFMHPMLADLFGLDKVEADLAPIVGQIHHEDIQVFKGIYPGLRRNTFTGSVTIRVINDNKYSVLRIVPILTSQGNDFLIVGSAEDITGETEHNESILKYANKKNSVLHMLGHDLRGPLNIARTLLEVMQKQMTDGKMLDQAYSVKSILESSLRLINDLLTREFLETTELVLVRKRTDIVKMITEYLDEYMVSETVGRKIGLSASAEHIFMDIDDAKFMQVLNNLMSNSLKFTREGDSIMLTISELDDQVRFDFSDSGLGIPPDKLPTLFERFSDAGRNGLNGEPSVGLGLSIVKQIIQWHGGSIWCDSEEGTGTTMHFVLPKSGTQSG
ncbi:HAMP domain-containing sensor histidine kinase [Pedobacter sp. JY14-1]|uniref:sensor histidine kinase n=1 Tax=Pedobacter sp. JY14-1 TaxID=3034151 RepID=UPI0023E1A098|nr:HAMP domain-containing sensor histidine kinase [Pedobacter sp. JY14-1]